MKTLFTVLFISLAVYSNSQTCNDFYNFKTGTTIEYIHNNAKGKMESVSKMTVTDVTTENGVVAMKTSNSYFDDKEKETYNFQQTYYCQDGNITFDMSSMFDPKVMEGYKDMQVKMESDKLDLPNTLTIGQTLKEGSATMTIFNQGIKMMTMNVRVYNRKVEAKESITVPAGTYECYKITYDVESKVLFKVQAKSTEWYAKGVGLVKQETYDSKGKITGSQELKSYKN